jgi:hypothetical protein
MFTLTGIQKHRGYSNCLTYVDRTKRKDEQDMTNQIKRMYRKIVNIIYNKEKCFLITKTWHVRAKDVKEALLNLDKHEHLDISVKEKKE